MKHNYKKMIGLSVVAMTLLGSSAYAGKIITNADLDNIQVVPDTQFGFGGWNFDNVDVRIVNIADFSTALPGSEFNTTTGVYKADVEADISMGTDMSFESDIRDINYSTGAPIVGSTVMGHLHGKDWPVGEPAGIKIINGDTKTSNGKPENCIMTSSYLPFQDMKDDTSGSGFLDAWPTEPNPVLCSSPWQSHKRYKINLLPTTVETIDDEGYGQPVDIVFNLDSTDMDTNITRYQVLQKVNNYTGKRLDGYKVEVLDENGSTNDALTLSLGIGENNTTDPVSNIWDDDELANYSHGLWGPYQKVADVVRFENGFFDFERSYYPAVLGENNQTISHIGPMEGGNYQEIFGNWLPSIWAPMGIFHDDDMDPGTDGVLLTFYGVAPGETEQAWWTRTVVDVVPNDATDPVYTWVKATEAELALWQGEWYAEDHVEDVLNLGLNYIIEVGENAKIGSTFTLRLTPHVDTNQTPPSSYRSKAKNDFNGDGISDIIFYNDDGSIDIWYMNANGSYTVTMFTTPDESDSWQVESIGDFDSNGVADILWRNTDNRVGITYMDTDGSILRFAILATVSDSWKIESTGDYDGNGVADILWRNTDNRVGITYLDTDGSYLRFAVLATVSDSWEIEYTGDFDGNGVTDILWRSTDNRIGITYIFEDGKRKFSMLATVSDSWKIESTGDYDGNGVTDILWRSTDNRIGITYMSADGNRRFAIIDTTSDSWEIESTGDFDGNGVTDIQWKSTDDEIAITYIDTDGSIMRFEIITTT